MNFSRLPTSPRDREAPSANHQRTPSDTLFFFVFAFAARRLFVLDPSGAVMAAWSWFMALPSASDTALFLTGMSFVLTST